MTHREQHLSHRAGWLRASVMGANDGIVSTASLIIGVAAAEASADNILLAGLAGLVAGAMSMAAAEYVSVSSQRDTERADIAMERRSLRKDFESETQELSQIYQQRGLEPELARQVAEQLMAHDALAAHMRDDIGITEITNAKPVQAAVFSACTFSLGGGFPLLVASCTATTMIIPAVVVASLLCLALLGASSARAGGASMRLAAWRVSVFGALAMAATAAAGHLFGVVF